MFAVLAIRYSAARLDWLMTELDQLYLPHSCDGRGFLSLIDIGESERRSLAKYLYGTYESLWHYARDVLGIKDTGDVDGYIVECCQHHIIQWKNKGLHGEF